MVCVCRVCVFWCVLCVGIVLWYVFGVCIVCECGVCGMCVRGGIVCDVVCVCGLCVLCV